MNHRYLAPKRLSFSLAVLLPLFLYRIGNAQITITAGDFADAGDTARMSVAVWNPQLDYNATGANHVWDFSSLQWQSQYVDEFLNPLSTGVTYAVAFSNLPINPFRSNIAQAGGNILTSFPVLSSVFTEGMNFYYKNNSLYRQRGIGMKVSGIPTPIPMTHGDTLYRFPINYGNRDSAWSEYTVPVPQLGIYSHKQQRINEVDGWGSLTTPFGTFDVLRVKTEIRGSDSLYIDSLHFGLRIPNDIQREYKWFTKDQLEPVLQINTQAGILSLFPSFEFVTKVIYRDSVRFLPTAIRSTADAELSVNVFPNPNNGQFYISIPETITDGALSVSDLSGRIVVSRSVAAGVQSIDLRDFAKGIYLLRLQSAEGKAAKKIVIQ